jgi:hypothetical protein
MKTPSICARALAKLSLALFLPAMAAAQQTPVTGQMMGQGSAMAPVSGGAAPVPAPAPEPEPSAAGYASGGAAPRAAERPPAHATVIGETTRSLLQMQADGTQAGQPLPMLGAEASVSYDRYLKSFSHEIPEFYKTAVGKDSNGSAGGQ